MSAINPVYCPSCKKSDNVSTASKANLTAPPKPSDIALTFVKIWRIISGALFALVVGIFLCGFVFTACTALFAGTQDSTGISTLFAGTTLIPMLCIAPFSLAVIGAITVLTPWLVWRYVNQSYQKQMAQWQKAMDKWNKLYYCSADAGVFLEGQNRLVPLEQMRSFLYEIEPTQAPLLHGI